jgi:hypothetical protein
MCHSEQRSHSRAFGGHTLHTSAIASSKLASVTRKSVALRVALQKYKSSARAEARARTSVGQSVEPQPNRAGTSGATRMVSFALPRGLQLQLGARAYASTATPNPSIEGMPKRLRLLVTPHVKR